MREEYWRLTGGYRHVNRRLRALVGEPARRRQFRRATSSLPRDTARRRARPPPASPGGAPTRPAKGPPAALADGDLRAAAPGARRHRDDVLQAHQAGARRLPPPTEVLDESAGPGGGRDPARDGNGDGCPAARCRRLLHAVLETVPLERLREAPALEAWAARPDVPSWSRPAAPARARPAYRGAPSAWSTRR